MSWLLFLTLLPVIGLFAFAVGLLKGIGQTLKEIRWAIQGNPKGMPETDEWLRSVIADKEGGE